MLKHHKEVHKRITELVSEDFAKAIAIRILIEYEDQWNQEFGHLLVKDLGFLLPGSFRLGDLKTGDYFVASGKLYQIFDVDAWVRLGDNSVMRPVYCLTDAILTSADKDQVVRKLELKDES